MAFGWPPSSAALRHRPAGVPLGKSSNPAHGRQPPYAMGLTPRGVGPRSPGVGGGRDTTQQVLGGADTRLHPFLDGPGGVSAGLGAEAARGAQGGGKRVSKPEGEPDPGDMAPLCPQPQWADVAQSTHTTAPPGHSCKRGCSIWPRWFAPQGAGHPSPRLPQGRTSSSLAQHCFFQAFCPRATSPAVARTRGLSLHKEGCSGTLSALLRSQHPFGGLKKKCMPGLWGARSTHPSL